MKTFELQQPMLDMYWYFIKERHNIYSRRVMGKEFPWTDDKVLQRNKFTNVYRELDRVTIWVRENIREPYANHPELFYNLMVARLFNWPKTLANIGFVEQFDHDRILSIVKGMRDRGEKFTTGAYMLTGTLGGKGTTKDIQLVSMCMKPLWENRRELEPKRGDTLQSAFKRIAGKTPGYAGFIAYEVITDLRHTRYLETAGDVLSWAHAGPGAHRGIRRLLGVPVSTRGTHPRTPERKVLRDKWPTKQEALKIMRHVLSLSVDALAGMPPFEMREIEHTLCEFDKYMRARNGGRMRAVFVPPDERDEEYKLRETFPRM